jgi:hypothetical protein
MRNTSKWLASNDLLLFRKELAKKIGLNEAVFLQQLHYWLEKDTVGVEINGIRWVYNSYIEWQETNFPFWSIKTIQRIINRLEKMRLIVSQQASKRHYDRRKYYRINYEELERL